MDARGAERRAAMIELIGGFDAAGWLGDIGLSVDDVLTLEELLH